MKLRTNTVEGKMTNRFDAFMEKIANVNKIFWIVGFFSIVVLANLFGYGG